MSQIEAIYRHGVFEPIGSVDLPEEQRVTLKIEPLPKETPQEWLERVSKRQAEIFQREGFFPDSTLDIAEDRRR
jgi:predicted DNA-binding antitoxin AbrB/MazE fold protein